MEFPVEERIGEQELFTNRQEELAFFDSWVRNIEKKVAISTAIVSHRKVGKTAVLQRLYNQLFRRHDRVIPFLLEIEEQKRMVDEFSRIYFIFLKNFKKRTSWNWAINSPPFMTFRLPTNA